MIIYFGSEKYLTLASAANLVTKTIVAFQAHLRTHFLGLQYHEFEIVNLHMSNHDLN